MFTLSKIEENNVSKCSVDENPSVAQSCVYVGEDANPKVKYKLKELK